MKLILSIILLLLFACTDATTDPVDAGQTNNVIWPLKIGNKWVYTIFGANHNLINTETRRIVSVNNSWYGVAISSQENVSELSNLADGLHLKTSNSQTELLIKYPAALNDQFTSTGSNFMVISTDTMITTAAGTFECYLYQRFDNGKLSRSNFYAVDIGYIKRVNYDTATGTLLSTFELSSYELK